MSETGPTPEELDEAYKINDEIDRGEITVDQIDGAEKVVDDIETAEKSAEFELTPEIEEMIMAKVQDILSNRTAFHGIGFNGIPRFFRIYNDNKKLVKDKSSYAWRLRKDSSGVHVLSDEEKDEKIQSGLIDTRSTIISVFRDGLLGYEADIMSEENKGRAKDSIKNKWAYMARKKRNTGVHFNIYGESGDFSNLWTKDGLAVIFDLDKYSLDQKDRRYEEAYNMPGKRLTYTAIGAPHAEYGNQINPNYGFKAYYRVPPRFFTGLVSIFPKWNIPEDMDDQKDYLESLHLQAIISSELEVWKDKTDLLLPIYDDKGSLLWPKKMSYEEVKQFVKDRDEQK